MTDEPVAWNVIEPGWRVLDAAGNEIGKVDRITGDLDADIFDGLAVGDGGTVLTRAKYVPSEHVAVIRDGEIVLDLSPEEAAKLEPYTEIPSKPLADLAPKEETSTEQRSRWSDLLDGLFGRRRPT
jgi:hypothetical protein